MAGTKVIHVDWEPRKVILDVEQLKALEELAYRRILDLIYVHGNRLIDDDAELERMTKTGRKWPAIKKRLIEVHEKLYVSDDGYLRNDKCDEKCAEIERYIAQKSGAGKASAEKRKSKKNNDVGSTGGGTETPTEDTREGQRQTNQPYHPSIDKKEAGGGGGRGGGAAGGGRGRVPPSLARGAAERNISPFMKTGQECPEQTVRKTGQSRP